MRTRSKFEFAFVSAFFWPFFAVSLKLRRRYFQVGFGGGGGEHIWCAKREPYRTGGGRFTMDRFGRCRTVFRSANRIGRFWSIFDFTCKRRFYVSVLS